MFTLSIAVVGAADLDDPCDLALFPAHANFLNVYGEMNLIDFFFLPKDVVFALSFNNLKNQLDQWAKFGAIIH